MNTSTKLIGLIFSTMAAFLIIVLILSYIFKITIDLLTISINCKCICDSINVDYNNFN